MRYLYIDTNIFLNILLAEDPADSIHLAIAQENKTEFVTRDAELSNKIKGMINTYIPEML